MGRRVTLDVEEKGGYVRIPILRSMLPSLLSRSEMQLNLTKNDNIIMRLLKGISLSSVTYKEGFSGLA